MLLKLDSQQTIIGHHLPDGYIVVYNGTYLMQSASKRAHGCINELLHLEPSHAPIATIVDLEAFFAWCDERDLWIKLLI